MIYLCETELKENKSLNISFTGIFGIGLSEANKLCKIFGLTTNIKISELKNNQKLKLMFFFKNYTKNIGDDLKQSLDLEKKKKIEIKLYRGLRRLKGYPVRGQRTRTNAKTSKKKF